MVMIKSKDVAEAIRQVKMGKYNPNIVVLHSGKPIGKVTSMAFQEISWEMVIEDNPSSREYGKEVLKSK